MYFKIYNEISFHFYRYIIIYTIHFLMAHFLELMVLDKEEANKLVGTTTIPILIQIIIVVNTLSPKVIGYMSL